MGIVYAAGWQVSTALTMSGTVEGNAFSIPAGLYMHGDLDTDDTSGIADAAYQGTRYQPFGAALKTALDAAAPGTFTVTWSHTTALYTVSRASNFALAFAGAGGSRLADALGYTSNKSGAIAYTSDVVPVYAMVTAVEGRTGVDGPREPDDIAEEGVTSGGLDHVITRKSSEMLVDWTQQCEPRTSVYERAATGVTSWQHWFRSTRGTHPFFVGDSYPGDPNGSLYRLTARGASFVPSRLAADDDTFFTLPFAARYLGAFV